MAEYIERKMAYKLIKEQREKETGAYSKGRNKGLIIAGSIINNKEVLPTADVVEVVRCKDCRYYTTGLAVGMCKRVPSKPIFPCCYDNYCGWGERKEGVE